jgi:hypothetical protein
MQITSADNENENQFNIHQYSRHKNIALGPVSVCVLFKLIVTSDVGPVVSRLF